MDRYRSTSRDRFQSSLRERPASAELFQGSSSTRLSEVPRTPPRSGSADIFRTPISSLKGERKVQDLQVTLEDSESRRLLLVDRLREAKDTIQLQAKRLKDAQTANKENNFEVNDLKYKEQVSDFYLSPSLCPFK